ncbi:MAG: CoB--CoM heterodisulfide reductase iron-sulfur subunit B family protein, partial [Dehalococcoidia bacterium]
MKFAWYPGCVSQGGCPELFTATLAVAEKLGFELVHMKEAACTGAGVLSEKNPELADTLNARTFAMAEGLGLPIMTICSTCQGVMSAANARLTSDPEYLKKINETLAEEELEYKGTAQISHILWVIVEELGLEKLKSLVVRPLTGVRVAPFYGCYIIRPTSTLGFGDHPERDTYIEQITSVLGGIAVDYSGKTKCCGFPI